MNIENVTREEVTAVCGELAKLSQSVIINPERAYLSNLLTSFFGKAQRAIKADMLNAAVEQEQVAVLAGAGIQPDENAIQAPTKARPRRARNRKV